MKKEIRLVALDMDGTLFNNQSKISEENQNAIHEITSKGVEVTISTGRPYVGLPVELLTSIGIRYAITANGAGIYELSGKKLLHSSCMEPALVCPILEELQKKDIHMDAFIDGDGYSEHICAQRLHLLDLPESIRHYIRETRTYTDDLAGYIRERNLSVEKMTLNFYPEPDGSFHNRETVKEFLASRSEITYLSGGYHNLEFTKAGTTKAMGLRFLCNYLGLSLEQTMACGDTENDIDIIKTAAIGVAMGNATEDVKKAADHITLSNEESGVAAAIRSFICL